MSVTDLQNRSGRVTRPGKRMARTRCAAQAMHETPTRWLAFALACLFLLAGEPALALDQTVNVAVLQQGPVFIVDATAETPVAINTAWEVLTDFDHMTSILGNLTASEVTSRNGNIWTVKQRGVARYGLFTFSFESVREIQLDPMKRIVARNLSGTVTRMSSVTELVPLSQGVQIRYHVEMEPGSMLARMFGLSFVRHEVEEQLQRMMKEMTRRTS
jgi:hypothetical protein